MRRSMVSLVLFAALVAPFSPLHASSPPDALRDQLVATT
jgi:hypothetical protein